MSDVSVSQSLSSKLQVITQSIIVIIHNKPVIQNKKPPETVSFPAALPVSFHGIGTVCRKADILPEVINEDYPSLCKTDIGPYFRGHWQCGNIPYGVILPRDQVEDMAVRPFAYARIINISIV